MRTAVRTAHAHCRAPNRCARLVRMWRQERLPSQVLPGPAGNMRAMQNSILVTGGAGYIGSHVARQLGERGEEAGHARQSLDRLSRGRAARRLRAWATPATHLVARVLAEHKVDTVLHFAAHIVVPESVANPLKYYRNNTCEHAQAARVLRGAGVKHFIFSSTAAVYGIPAEGAARRGHADRADQPLRLVEADERADAPDVAAATPLRYVALRYFNVAGPTRAAASVSPRPRPRTSSRSPASTSSASARPIFGTDYATPDGTCIRDYIHVEDLAAAHLQALDYLRAGGAPRRSTAATATASACARCCAWSKRSQA